MANATETIDLDAMHLAATQACRLLKVLANPQRMMLLCQLMQREHCVSELETVLGIGQPTLSQQLSVLRDEHLVHTRRDGKQIFYSISSAEAMATLQLLYELFCPKNKGAAARSASNSTTVAPIACANS